MDKERLKLIVRNLELLVDGLKAEVYSDVDAYTVKESETRPLDYDEIFEDDDDWNKQSKETCKNLWKID